MASRIIVTGICLKVESSHGRACVVGADGTGAAISGDPECRTAGRL